MIIISAIEDVTFSRPFGMLAEITIISNLAQGDPVLTRQQLQMIITSAGTDPKKDPQKPVGRSYDHPLFNVICDWG